MTKIETSIACIECGNKLLERIYPMMLEYSDNFDKFSSFEKETYNTIIGSQFALICEYYLKGLFIPNIQVIIPKELRKKIDTLTEEQELMIIVSDDEKIRKDPILSKLDKKELRLLLSINSLKSFGHSLISLLGTETFEENKRIVLPLNVRESILGEMQRRLLNSHDNPFKTKNELHNYMSTPIHRAGQGRRLLMGDKIIEENIALSSVSDAFPKGRYAIFDGFTSNVSWIVGLTLSVRNSFKHQFSNLIEVFKSKDDSFGKFIYPDKETKISIKGTEGTLMEYEMVAEIGFYYYGTEVFWNASRTMLTPDELEQLKVLSKYSESPKIAHQRIYLDEYIGANCIEYMQDSQIKQMSLNGGIMYEISPELIKMKEDNSNNHRLK